MQVANDVTSANELPSREPAQAGALTTPPLPESCRAASSARIASRALWSVVSLAESAAFVAYEASSVASALAPWSAAMLASRLASCAATKALVARPSRAFAILVSTSSGVSNPFIVESREASALASALPRRGVQGCRGDSVQEGCRYLRVHLRGSVHGRLQGVSSQGAGVCLGGRWSPERRFGGSIPPQYLSGLTGDMGGD